MNEIEFEFLDDFDELYISCIIFHDLHPDSEYTGLIAEKLLELANTDEQKRQATWILASKDRRKAEGFYMELVQRLIERNCFTRTLSDAICDMARWVLPLGGRFFIEKHWKDFTDSCSLLKLGNAAALSDHGLARKIFEYAEKNSKTPDEFYILAASIKKHTGDNSWIQRLLLEAEKASMINHMVNTKALLGAEGVPEEQLKSIDKKSLLGILSCKCDKFRY